MFSAYHLTMVYNYTKFHETNLNGSRVMERTRKGNRRMDRQTDGWMPRHITTRLRWTYKIVDGVPVYVPLHWLMIFSFLPSFKKIS